ncbi:unnamed protein product [Discosporangium mesarthrocarpum]
MGASTEQHSGLSEDHKYPMNETDSALTRPKEGRNKEPQVRETEIADVELTADGFLQQINEYECIRDLGVGATAEVKLCRRVDAKTGEEELVAVKVFNKSLLNRQARGCAFGRRRKSTRVSWELGAGSWELTYPRHCTHLPVDPPIHPSIHSSIHPSIHPFVKTKLYGTKKKSPLR